jgi:hypothetical protein
MANKSLLTFPVELLHRILDYCDAQTILHSFRLVCTQFYAVVNTYNRFELEFTSVSKSDVKLFSRCIQPENIISLTFVDTRKVSYQLDLFSTYFDIRRFCRLRSLGLPQICVVEPEQFFYAFIGHAAIPRTIDRILALLSSAIAQGSLQKLYLKTSDYIMQRISWPVQCTLKNLTMRVCRLSEYHIILSHSSYLRTFVMKNCIMNNIDRTVMPTSTSSCYPQLESLTITECKMTTSEFEYLLSLTPSLFRLKLISRR